MCAGVVEGNLCNRLWTLLYSPSPHRRLPRNAEALLASETRQLLKMLLALSWFPHLSGQKGNKRGCRSLLPLALPGGTQELQGTEHSSCSTLGMCLCWPKWKPQGLMQKLSAGTVQFVFHRELDGTITFPSGSKSLSKVKMHNLGQTTLVFLGSYDGCMEA